MPAKTRAGREGASSPWKSATGGTPRVQFRRPVGFSEFRVFKRRIKMGKRGKLPKSEAEKLYRGDPGHEGRRKLLSKMSGTTGSDARPANIPPAPDWLSESAKNLWVKTAQDLIAMGAFANIDSEVLAGYCLHLSRAVECEKTLSEKGFVIEHHNGTIGARPEVKIAEKAWSAAQKLGAMLGVGHGARQRMGIRLDAQVATSPETEIDENPYAEFDAVLEQQAGKACPGP